MKLNDTAALVTGAASGLGQATASALAAAGVRVFGLDLPDAADTAPNAENLTYLGVDVTQPDQVAAAVEAAASSGTPLRTVVNCAGISAYAPILTDQGHHDLALFRRVVEINLIGTVNVTVLAAEAMANTQPLADNARGVVINTTSIGAFDGIGGTSAYAASKCGVAGLTLPAARDLSAHGIRVMAIAPGIFDTAMFGMGQSTDEIRAAAGANVPFPKRIGRPEEFAQLVIDIIERDYLNGEVIRFDGSLRLG
jgi:NAD(P)-dependent dehydrogenase (short-subunit alcohol dehydrogenase family)